MAENLGTGVSLVNDPIGYNYDTVVFQKGKPPLDSELNLAQDTQRLLSQRHFAATNSGWLSMKPFYTDKLLSNQFYTQNPSIAVPEYALVNGNVLYVTNTAKVNAANLIDLGAAPSNGARVSAVYLESWRALIAPNNSTNRPDPTTTVDAILDVDTIDANHAWAVGENGLILGTTNGGQTWNVLSIDTKKDLNSVYFVTGIIGWVCGDNGVIARTTSEGQRWNLLNSGYTENLNGVFAISQSIAWAVGNAGLILKTTNGMNWTALNTSVTTDLNYVYFHDSLIGWVVGKNGLIMKTTNGGQTWIQYSSGTTNTLNSIYFYDDNFGFAVGANGTILRSSDGGATWISQSGNINTGSGYTSYSVDYTDVTMVPNLDEYVDGEEISGQFNGSNKNCTVMHAPITNGNGLGITTNVPTDIIVKVNGVPVAVDVLNGATGQIILANAPATCQTVKVYYYYKISTSIFRGSAWITGKNHTSTTLAKNTAVVLYSTDIGANWTEQDPNTSYDLNAVAFADKDKGWVVGSSSIVRYTSNHGVLWSDQQTNQIIHQVQRVYNEGNILGPYLPDDTIHPDVNIETTKRVQIQYAIRVVSNADPFSYPDAGLGSSAVTARGPNTNGVYTYENMGPINGDYGLWRAKCAGTVDGYCYAIPMFFVARRNTSPYSDTNINGETKADLTAIRPDLLTAANIVDTDILDVRRISVVPSVEEMLNENFEALMDNSARNLLARETSGGVDRYGTELLHTDTVGSGGTLTDVTLTDAALGNITAAVQTLVDGWTVGATTVVPVSSSSSMGIYHQNPVYYAVVYNSSSEQWNRKPVPGTWSGIGTNSVTFTFSSHVNTTNEDSGLIEYELSAVYFSTTATKSLTKMPSKPCLLKNVSGAVATDVYYYQGVFETDTYRTIETWDSGISGYPNFTVVYPGDSKTSATEVMASTVELHYFIKATSSASTITVPLADLNNPMKYSIYTISQVVNRTASYNYKIKNVVYGVNNVVITAATGFTFIQDSVYEIIAKVKSDISNVGIRNGASANFDPSKKAVNTFCVSCIATVTDVSPNSEIDVNIYDAALVPDAFIAGTVIGASSVERVPVSGDVSGNTLLPVCWVRAASTSNPYEMHPAKIRWGGAGNFFITLLDADTFVIASVDVQIQIVVLQNQLIYGDNSTDKLYISYYYAPNQTVADLPSTLTVKSITRPGTLYISNLGTGGSNVVGEPYAFPLLNIPLADKAINDNYFYNVEELRFANFSVDTGFVSLPIYVPGNLKSEMTLSGTDVDSGGRVYYKVCSKEFKFSAEGLLTGAPRKIFTPILCQVTDSDNRLFLKGEYLLVITSRNDSMGLENYTGYIADDKCVLAIYRLKSRPVGRI